LNVEIIATRLYCRSDGSFSKDLYCLNCLTIIFVLCGALGRLTLFIFAALDVLFVFRNNSKFNINLVGQQAVSWLLMLISAQSIPDMRNGVVRLTKS
jgi:hypothetical protein